MSTKVVSISSTISTIADMPVPQGLPSPDAAVMEFDIPGKRSCTTHTHGHGPQAEGELAHDNAAFEGENGSVGK